jgi:hypothetical protein
MSEEIILEEFFSTNEKKTTEEIKEEMKLIHSQMIETRQISPHSLFEFIDRAERFEELKAHLRLKEFQSNNS